MNRHSPLFRIAILSLLLAIALPLLVFVASQVRYRQLQSKANPRWAQFAAINGPKAEVTTKPTIKPAIQTKSSDSTGATARRASRTNDLTGSATDSMPVAVPLTEAARPAMPLAKQTAPQRLASAAQLPPTPLAAQVQPPSGESVPEPAGDAPKAESELPSTAVTAQPDVTSPDKPNTNDATPLSTGRIEQRLLEMQRRLDQLAQAQNEKQNSDLNRAESQQHLLQQANQNPGLRPADPSHTEFFLPPSPAPSPDVVPGPVQTPRQRATPNALPSWLSGTVTNSPNGRDPSIKIFQSALGDEDERFSIQTKDSKLTEVLEMLGVLAGVNILTSPDVDGRVTLNLRDVTVDRALDAILKSQGLVHERDGDFIYVRTAAKAKESRP